MVLKIGRRPSRADIFLSGEPMAELPPPDDLDAPGFPTRIYDDLSDRERRFVDAWMNLKEELEETGEFLTEGQQATRAAVIAGWPEDQARKAGWRLLRSVKVRKLIHEVAGATVMAAHLMAVKRLVRVVQEGTDGHAVKAAQEIIALNEDLKKVLEVKNTHEIEATGEALNAELEAAFARRGVTVINGGELVPVQDAAFEPVTVRPATGLEPEANRVEGPERHHQRGGNEASARRLHSARGPNHVLKPQRPDRPRRGRKPKTRLVPGKVLAAAREAALGIRNPDPPPARSVLDELDGATL